MTLEIPLTSIFPSFFVISVYFVVGFAPTFDQFLSFWIACIMQCLTGFTMGVFVGTLLTDLKASVELAPMIFIPFALYNGFTTNTESIILPLKIIEYISPMRYTFEFLVRNEFQGTESLLQETHPIKTLNFSFSKSIIILVMSLYIIGMSGCALLGLKYNSSGVTNWIIYQLRFLIIEIYQLIIS